MKLHSQSVWQAAARRRWPGMVIRGDGAIALVCPTTQVVDLHFWPLGAFAAMSVDHGNFRCTSDHRMAELQPEPTAQPVRNMADMERD
jgi:hypothetical protein